MSQKPHIPRIKTLTEQLNNALSKMDWITLEHLATQQQMSDRLPITRKLEAISKDLSGLDVDNVSPELVNGMLNDFENLSKHLVQLQDQVTNTTRPGHSFNSQGFQNDLNQIVQYFHNFMRNFVFVSAAAQFMNGSSIQSTVSDARLAFDRFKNDLAAKTAEFEKWVTDAKDKYTQAFIAKKYGDQFNTAADSIRIGARNWLIFTFLLVGILILGAYLVFYAKRDVTGPTELAQLLITKALVAAGIFYLINLSIKTYRAQKHNQILNEHRHLALETFDIFQRAGKDDVTKNAVLMEVTRTIFANQQTGYASGGESDSDTPTKIIEILRGK